MLNRAIRVAALWKKKLLRRIRPISADQISQVLNDLAQEQLELLFVHSSLSSCGFIAGGPAVVISTLQHKCKTLVLPTHTYCYPSKVGAVGPAFDPAVTPSVVGAISNWFWQQPNVIRSIHPTHSLAAFGPKASAICLDHQLSNTPCGVGTPYERLIQQRAAVLMYGCTMNTYTLFHTSEDLAKCPYLYYPDQVDVSYVDSSGRTVVAKMWRQNMEYARRFESMEEELMKVGLLRSARLRDGKLLYIPDSLAVHNYLMDRFETNPRHLLRDS